MPAYKDTKRGTWYIKFSCTDRISGKRKQILKRGFPTKREATQWEAEQRTVKAPATSITFRELLGKYFDYKKPRIKTRLNYTSNLENHFPYMDMEVDKLTKQKLMEWYLDLTEQDLSPGTTNLVLTIVKLILRFGNEYYELPNHSLTLKRMKAVKRKYNTWTVEEFNRFLECVESPLYRAAFITFYWVGLRKGELLGLQYTDFKDGTFHVHQQMTEHGLAPLKTEASERTLKLADVVLRAVEPFLGACSEERPFIFGGEKALPSVTLQDQFKRAINRSGVPDIRIHDLRHSFATNMICSGASIVAVSRYLGHSSINITLSTYTHLLQKTDDEMLEIMNLISKTD